MTAIYSATTTLFFILLFGLVGCENKTVSDADTIALATDQPNEIADSLKKKANLEKVYTQAIGDYIQLVNTEYQLTFDTLYFGKHVFGQPDDFPDIELPASIEHTCIMLINPEEGKKKRNSSFYINLIGWVNAYDAEFTFVTFSNGFAHQFDCIIKYNYDSLKKEFVMETKKLDQYQYKRK